MDFFDQVVSRRKIWNGFAEKSFWAKFQLDIVHTAIALSKTRIFECIFLFADVVRLLPKIE